MKLAVIIVAILAVVTATTTIKKPYPAKYFDKDMVSKQKFFLDVLFKVWEPFYFEEYKGIGDKFVYDKSYFVEYDKDMDYFYELYKSHTFVPRGVTFTIFNKRFLKEASGLFKFFYYAKDFTTLQKNILWARTYINEGVYVYALQMFLMHSEHYTYVVLPPLYEIFPFYFFNGKFIYTVKDFDFDVYKYEQNYEKTWFEFYNKLNPYVKMWISKFDWFNKKFHFFEDKKLYRDEFEMETAFKYDKIFDGMKMFWVKSDFSDKYDILNEEYKLTYLTEDFDWNLYWYYYNMQYPYWLDGKKFKLSENHGESFLFTIKQILARYYNERYSNAMGPIPKFSFYHEIEHGYNPQLVTYSGISYSYRPNYYHIFDTSKQYTLINQAAIYKERIWYAISHGYYVMADGSKYYFNKPESIEEIGLIIKSSVDCIDRKFFGSWLLIYHTVLAFGEEYPMYAEGKYFDDMPNVMWNFATMMRDPLFYQIYSEVFDIYQFFKIRMGKYEKPELNFPGVKIIDVETDKLVTYFDVYDADVSVLLDKDFFFKDGKFDFQYGVFGRRVRLNNKPFHITYKYESDKAQKIVFRTFIGPKYDEYGREESFELSKKHFYEIDYFLADAIPGENSFVRFSNDFSWTHNDFTTYFELYKYAFAAYEGNYKFPVDYKMNKFCGFPKRLVLPRGWIGGMAMKIYVIATPYDTSFKTYTPEEEYFNCCLGYDKHALGYPLDRPIDIYKFWTPNMYYDDIFIYHLKDLHVPSDYKIYYNHEQSFY